MKKQKSLSIPAEPKKGPNIEVVHRIMARVAEWMEETGRTNSSDVLPMTGRTSPKRKTKKKVETEAVQA